MAVLVRPLRRDDAEIALVADRMRLTLIEVLGEAGREMYSTEWLRERVRWHLDREQCSAEVFVAERNDIILGHTIVRLEPSESGGFRGLFSTIYVTPEQRRCGVADALITQGEAWLTERGMTTLGTDTSATNHRLIALFGKHGYEIVLRVAETNMVHLSKTLT